MHMDLPEMDTREFYAALLIVVFGALTIGGLMAGNLVVGHETGFLFAFAASAVAWACAPAVLFDRPRIYLGLLLVCVVLIAISLALFL